MAGEETKPKVKSFSCPSCGGAVTLRYPGAALSCVCSFCGSIIDVSNNNCRILTEHFNRTASQNLLLPLGSRGQISGRTWEIIGYTARRDLASSYTWEEYLLFNPYYGYRWLTCNDRHWSFVSVTKEKPVLGKSSHRTFQPTKAYFEGDEFRLFYKGKAEVTYVIGEFYWKVKAGTQVTMADYINPPLMISSEADGKEMVWSVSQYITVDEVEKAFKPERKLIRPLGIAPNQYSGVTAASRAIGWLWVLFICILTGLQFWQLTYNSGTSVMTTQIPFTPNTANKITFTSPVFSITRPITGSLVKLSAPVDNSWVWASGEMVNDDTGATFPFARTCEYYHGYSDGEYWSEGSGAAEVFISKVPAGKYYLNVDWESGDFKTTEVRPLNIEVFQAPKMYGNYCLIFCLLSIIPAFSAWAAIKTDQARWMNSDFSPYGNYGD